MAHPQQMKFMELAKSYFLGDISSASVLEIGSYDVNGGIRRLFEGSKSHIGADLAPGPRC